MDAKPFADGITNPAPEFVTPFITARTHNGSDREIAIRGLYAFFFDRHYDSKLNLLYFAFVVPASGRDRPVRYYSPEIEISFCGHATIAKGVVLGERADVFHSRNPFPVGGVVEDPATGASAAALGGYLREAGLIAAPSKILIRQGEAMGRPSRLNVDIPALGGIIVSGAAVPNGDSTNGL